MEFDKEGHLLIKPSEFYSLLLNHPLCTIRDVLVAGTPLAFPSYSAYCGFLHEICDRLNLAPKQIIVRGSCHLGFSTSPRPNKAWYGIRNGVKQGEKPSDLDLAIIDLKYYEDLEYEVAEWEKKNPLDGIPLQGEYRKYLARQKDRIFYCCRDEDLPPVVGVHHRRVIADIPVQQFCGVKRDISAHIYRDWYSVENRYVYDLNELRREIEAKRILMPGESPLV